MPAISDISHLGATLGELQTSVSLVESPGDWLEANIDHIHNTVEELSIFSKDELPRSVSVYPVGSPSIAYVDSNEYVLSVYLYIHRHS